MSDALSFNPEVGLSRLMPDNLQFIYFQFVYGDWPWSVQDLEIDGNDLVQLGYSGKEIGKTLQDLLVRIYNNEIKNDRRELLKTLKTLV